MDRQIGEAVRRMEQRLGETHYHFHNMMDLFDRTIIGELTPEEFIRRTEKERRST